MNDDSLPVHHVAGSLRALGTFRIAATTTEAEAEAAFRSLGTFNGCTLGLIRFEGQTPWERHAEDELLHFLEGEVELTVLFPDGSAAHATASAGTVVVVPRDCWHRQHARRPAALLFVTSATELSEAEDPRRSAT